MVHIHQIHIFMRCIGRTADVGLLIVGCDFEWLEMLLICTVELATSAKIRLLFLVEIRWFETG
jgi:hypothetical protein